MTMTDFDPTINRIHFGLLSADERTTLVNWKHGWEYYAIYDECWNATDNPAWKNDSVYRGKPKPVVTSRWFNILPLGPFSHIYLTLESADNSYGSDFRIAVLRIDTCNGVSTAHLDV